MEHQEAQARATLLDMQERLARDPVAALGVTPTATAADVRAAFHQLAKTFHPARFGRMSTEVQRLANEVFLALRAAHDSVARSRPVRPSMPAGVPRAIPASGSQPLHAGARPTTPPALAASTSRPHVAPPPHPARPSIAPPTAARPSTSPAPGASVSRPMPAADSSGSFAVGTARGATATMPAAVKRTGPMPVVPRPRTAEMAPLARPPAAPEDREVVIALELLQRQEWESARAILQSLADRSPTVPRYRALVRYAVGRRAQIEGRHNDARIELDHALQIDPELQLAKSALGELFTRRK